MFDVEGKYAPVFSRRREKREASHLGKIIIALNQIHVINEIDTDYLYED